MFVTGIRVCFKKTHKPNIQQHVWREIVLCATPAKLKSNLPYSHLIVPFSTLTTRNFPHIFTKALT